MDDHFLALITCILSNLNPDQSLAKFGLKPFTRASQQGRKRSDDVYAGWQKQINNGSTYAQIGLENGISQKTVSALLIQWRRRSGSENPIKLGCGRTAARRHAASVH